MKWQPILAAGICIIGVLILPSLLFNFPFHRHTRQDVIRQIFGNEKTFDAVMSSQQVAAQLLKQDPDSPMSIVDKTYEPVSLSPEQVQQIKDLLGKASSYGWGYVSDCIPHYGVVFNFQSGGHTVRVGFCFKCNMVAVIDGAGDDIGGNTSGYPFDPMHKEMLAMCKTMFSNSQKIQDLQ